MRGELVRAYAEYWRLNELMGVPPIGGGTQKRRRRRIEPITHTQKSKTAMTAIAFKKTNQKTQEVTKRTLFNIDWTK